MSKAADVRNIFSVSAQKAVLDQQEGIVANALGRTLPASLLIRGRTPKINWIVFAGITSSAALY
jgi:hypothetical protein